VANEAPGEKTVITKTSRDMGELRDGLARWLPTRLPAGSNPAITSFDAPEANGMSSLTVLFDATWGGNAHRLVARVAPEAGSVPVFPTYDLDRQFRIIEEVHQATKVPLPPLFWSETDESFVGAPFFVMGRIEGRVPPDNPPYNLGSWVKDASPDERAHLMRSTLAALAEIHAIADVEARFPYLVPPAGVSPLRQHIDGQREYYAWTISEDKRRLPLVERAFEWLEDNWPDESAPALSWGDARIGNAMYQGFDAVAILDWEMAAIAPREVDLAWFIFLHRFFEDIAVRFEIPGIPDFLLRQDVVDAYVEASGYTPVDLDWYLVYACTRHAIVMAQTKRRSIHFGEDELPDDPDDMILHRPTLEAMLDGVYVWP
jgi:aminoglycoside phosphotransferase (APT) family kinase protein